MTDNRVLSTKVDLSPVQILNDYRLVCRSRQVSIVGRREVFTGKAKFGIFGSGKELTQVVMARFFQKGDFRSGYYRDQTIMFATGMLQVQEFFAQIYAHADLEAEPALGGRAMTGHFASRSLNPDGSWKNLTDQLNSSADVSPTGSQMPRLVGLGYASRLYRELPELAQFTEFSNHGNEIAFGTVGNASCAEGMVWEAINAIGVLQAPVVLTIYDDGFGISVPNDQQMVLGNMSQLLQGFQCEPGCREGLVIYTVPGWDYPTLMAVYQQAVSKTRQEHLPTVVHVTEMTQPHGHSTSGSHERYKTPERLAWEEEYDCNRRFRQWIIDQAIATEAELEKIEKDEEAYVEEARRQAWEAYQSPIWTERSQVVEIIERIAASSKVPVDLNKVKDHLLSLPAPLRRDLVVAIHNALLASRQEDLPARQELIRWKNDLETLQQDRYSSHLYSQSAEAALKVPEIKPIYSDHSPTIYGFEVLNACFDAALQRDPRVIAFGEDVGKMGDVNQGFKGLQAKYGELRVADTGIREATIAGQAIGIAMRGLRPIAEVQYLDYLLYALQILSDDLATLQWRTKGGQKAPVILRTRGHRLEGTWHSGSLMAGILNFVRGMYVLVPRDMTQAAGFYNTMLRSDDPALIVEVLNGYRIKERLPDNVGEFTVPLGIPDVLRPGSDVTLVTYGACCRIVLEAAEQLGQVGIEAEVIDVQTLLPFDLQSRILESLKKTSRVVFIDEDVPGGTTAYMLQEVIEKQGGYAWLDSPPLTLPGKPHRPAYGSDGDYWSKPNAEQVFETVYRLMNEVDPAAYPIFF